MDVLDVTGRGVTPGAGSTALSTVAAAITLANAVCGFAAIVVIAAGWAAAASAAPTERASFVAAVALIVAGSLLDLVDGPLARRAGGTSIGPQLDVAADAVTFGAAPALLVAANHSSADGTQVAAVSIGVCVYFVAVIWRVARFSMQDEHSARTRRGMSSPMAAFTLISVATLDLPAVPTTASLLLVAGLMVSRIPWPNPGRQVAPAIAAWSLLILAAIAGVVPGRLAAGVSLACVFLIPVVAALLPSTRRRGAVRC